MMPLCEHTFNGNMMEVSINDQMRDLILNDTVQEMAGQPLKVLSYAYKEIELQVYNQLRSSYDEESEEFRAEVERELIYIGTFGLNDPLRDRVEESIQLIRYGQLINTESPMNEASQQVNVRMVSGDHIETCRKVALMSSIISEDELHEEGVVITGEEFRNMIGVTQKIWDEAKQEFVIQFIGGKNKFDAVKKRVKVIARCTSEDKYIFVCGIKQKGGLVGMTGESINDADAL